ncbi:MAG: hypothetical protein K9M07_06185 [Simkaniaceae bacterium]|nr:hypothetical protein [Simkaniaceae bacterium]
MANALNFPQRNALPLRAPTISDCAPFPHPSTVEGSAASAAGSDDIARTPEVGVEMDDSEQLNHLLIGLRENIELGGATPHLRWMARDFYRDIEAILERNPGYRDRLPLLPDWITE